MKKLLSLMLNVPLADAGSSLILPADAAVAAPVILATVNLCGCRWWRVRSQSMYWNAFHGRSRRRNPAVKIVAVAVLQQPVRISRKEITTLPSRPGNNI